MISKELFRKKAVDRLRDGQRFCGKWRQAARDDYSFIAGDQWEPEDEELLKLQQRPTVTFNYSEKMIDAVGGAEVSNRQEVVYKPRGIEDAGLAELWTNASRWVRDECNAEDEETDAFRDALICGMGWIQTKMDYTENKDGMPVMDRIDPMEMIWDPASIKPGCADRRWDAWGIWMDDDLIAKMWPRKFIAGGSDMEDGSVGVIQTGNRYNGDDVGDDMDKRVDQTLIWHYQCIEFEPFYRVSTGDGNIEEMSPKDFNAMADQIKAFGLQYAKQMKKVYYRGFFAGTDEESSLLDFGPSPCQHGFTRDCITGKRDRNRNMWYGLTRVMKDPQRWANKWLAQIMHIINANAKGGLIAEQGAFVDPRKAQDEWANPDSVTMLNEGGIAKIKEKQMSSYPSGLSQMMQFALNSLPQVTGINLEALGLADRDQANVLEQSRKQAAYGLLAPIFDSLRRYRKMQGKVLLYFIREYISDGRLIRISGPGSEQWIPLAKAPDAVTFDIIVDQSSTAPDVVQRTWAALMQIVPPMIKAGLPLPPDLLTYAPLPQALIQKWQKFIKEKQDEAAQSHINPEQVKQMQEQIQQLTQENQQLQQSSAKDQADIQLKVRKQQVDEQLQALNMQFEQRMAAAEMEHKMRMDAYSTQGNLAIKAGSASAKSANDAESNASDVDFTSTIKDITSTFSDSIKAIVSAINEPKQVIRDSAGKLVGVKTVGKLPK